MRLARWTSVLATCTLATVAAAHVQGSETPRAAVRLDPPPRSVTVVATGDVLPELRVRYQAALAGSTTGRRYDFRPLFDPIASVVRSVDLAICHLELPIGRPDERPGYYGRSPFGGSNFLAPYELAADLADTGFDRCSTASNHSHDLGTGGIDSTLAALDAAGISSVGTARSAADVADRVVQVAGVRIGHLSYTTYSNTEPPLEPWALEFLRSPRQVIDDAAELRAAGAEIVLVSIHVSTELLRQPTAVDRTRAETVARSGAVDAIIHHGPHVVQPLEWVAGVPVFWSLGNFVSEMGETSTGRYADPRTSDGLLAGLRFTPRSANGATGWNVEAWTVAICNEPGTRVVRPATLGRESGLLSERQLAAVTRCVERIRLVVPDAM